MIPSSHGEAAEPWLCPDATKGKRRGILNPQPLPGLLFLSRGPPTLSLSGGVSQFPGWVRGTLRGPEGGGTLLIETVGCQSFSHDE